VASWLKKSIRYKPIKGLPFTRFQIIRAPFRAPSAYEIAEDGEFFVADCEGFCHLNAAQGKESARGYAGRRTAPSPSALN
jgi:hypothetical protein